MTKGIIRRIATVGAGMACVFVMSAGLPGCASTKCCGKDPSKCCGKKGSTASKCPKGCNKPCCKKT